MDDDDEEDDFYESRPGYGCHLTPVGCTCNGPWYDKVLACFDPEWPVLKMGVA